MGDFRDKDYDLSLAPLGRAAKVNGARVVAVVSMGYDRDNYQAPTLKLTTVNDQGFEGRYTDPGLEIAFQRHDVTSRHDGLAERPVARGFLASHRPRGASYGATVEFKVESITRAGKFLRIIERARDGVRMKWNPKADDCDLLAMIVGLRRLGVEIRVYNPCLRDRKVSRAAERQADRTPGSAYRAA